MLLLTEGQTADCTGAHAMLDALPDTAAFLIGDKGYDSDRLRADLAKRGIAPCIPPRKGRKRPATYCTRQYRRRNAVERFFGRIKDWRRIATRYDRCADLFMAAITIAAIVSCYINES